MKTIFFGLPGNEEMTKQLCGLIEGEIAEFTLRRFPDEETYLRITSSLEAKRCVIVCSLNHPDNKIISLYYLCRLCRDLKASKVILVAPYLSYMRQDIQFLTGEAVSSEYFANLLSQWVDELITIDPHLHRKHSMAELFTIPCTVLHAAPTIAEWILKNIDKPVLIGPDIESEQWVSEAARNINAPYTVLLKTRLSDRDVKVSVPRVEMYEDHTPVLIDDIISTARTMIETVGHLKNTGMKAPAIIGVHAIFAGNAFEDLQKAGAGQIITCNTIQHISNKIDLIRLIASSLY